MHGGSGGREDDDNGADLRGSPHEDNDPLTSLPGCDVDQVLAERGPEKGVGGGREDVVLDGVFNVHDLPAALLGSNFRLATLAPALGGLEKTGVRALRNSV